MTFDTLDKVLNVLYESDTSYILDSRNSKDKLWDIDYKDRISILKKLTAEGFVIENETEIFKQPVTTYVISFDGKMFYESSAIKGRPFHSRNIRNKWNTWYKTSKTIAIIINALAIIFISWLTYKSQDKSNLAEKQQTIIDSLNRLSDHQKVIIDSIYKSHIDTTKSNAANKVLPKAGLK